MTTTQTGGGDGAAPVDELTLETEPYFGFAGNLDENDIVVPWSAFLAWRARVRKALEAERCAWSDAATPHDIDSKTCSVCRAISEARAALDALVPASRPVPCPGRNCGCTDGLSHSDECRLEHEAATLGARIVWPRVRLVHRLRPGCTSAPWGITHPFLCSAKHEPGSETDGDTFVGFDAPTERVTCPGCQSAGSYQSAGVRS